MNGKNMDSMIRNLYAKIVLGGISGDAAIREREAEVDKELKSTEIELGQQEYEKFRDCALSVACTSEELGFILGMRYVISNIHRTCQGIFIIVFQQGCRPHMDGVHASGNRVFLQIHGCLHQCFRFHNSLQYAIPGWLFHCIQEFRCNFLVWDIYFLFLPVIRQIAQMNQQGKHIIFCPHCRHVVLEFSWVYAAAPAAPHQGDYCWHSFLTSSSVKPTNSASPPGFIIEYSSNILILFNWQNPCHISQAHIRPILRL